MKSRSEDHVVQRGIYICKSMKRKHRHMCVSRRCDCASVPRVRACPIAKAAADERMLMRVPPERIIVDQFYS